MTLKIIIWIIVAIAIILLIIAATLILPLLAMQPEETGVIEDSDIFAVKNRKNDVFFIKNGDEYILIDAGSDAQGIRSAMRKQDINPTQVKEVLLTHSDGDHVAGLKLFRDAKIHISEKEKPLLDKSVARAPFNLKYNSLPKGMSVEQLISLKDGQVLQFGIHKIECIQTAGHTKGSMSFLLDNKYLFTGDAFSIKDGEMKRHPYTMNGAKSDESIKKVQKLKESGIMLLSAHYGYLKQKREGELYEHSSNLSFNDGK